MKKNDKKNNITLFENSLRSKLINKKIVKENIKNSVIAIPIMCVKGKKNNGKNIFMFSLEQFI